MWISLALTALLSAGDAVPAEDRAAEPVIPSPLTLDVAEALFRQHGLDLLIAEAQVAGAEGDLRAAQIVQNPILSGEYLIGFAAGSGSNAVPAVPGFGVGLSDNAAIEDVLSGKRGLRVDIAKRALEAARQSRADAERTLLAQLRTNFAQAMLAQANADFAKDVQSTYERTRKLNQIRYDKGDINQVDLSRIIVAELEAEQSIAQANAQLAQAKAALGFLLGVRTHPLDFAVAYRDPAAVEHRTFERIDGSSADALTQDAFAHRPDLLAATATREQAALALTQARRQVLPDIALQVGYAQQFDASQPNGIVSPPALTIGLQAPIPLFYQQQGEIRRAEANLRAAEHQEQKARAQVVSDVASAYATYVATRDMIHRMQGGLLAAAKTSRDLEEVLNQKGASSLLEFLDAERTYSATNLEYRQDLEAYWAAVYQLEQATGLELQ